LPKIKEGVKEYYTNLQNGKVEEHPELNYVSKEEILNSSNVGLSYFKYVEKEILTSFDTISFKNSVIVSKPKSIKASLVLQRGKYPVIDQSTDFISGYSNDGSLLNKYDKPVIIFGDHTRIFKYVDFEFIGVGDAIKVLEPRDNYIPRFFYYLLSNYELQNLGYSRHFKLLKELQLPLPPLEIQKEIVEELEQYQKVIDGAKQVIEIHTQKIEERINKIWDD
jgi:restriction endonuclease S subunit